MTPLRIEHEVRVRLDAISKISSKRRHRHHDGSLARTERVIPTAVASLPVRDEFPRPCATCPLVEKIKQHLETCLYCDSKGRRQERVVRLSHRLDERKVPHHFQRQEGSVGIVGPMHPPLKRVADRHDGVSSMLCDTHRSMCRNTKGSTCKGFWLPPPLTTLRRGAHDATPLMEADPSRSLGISLLSGIPLSSVEEQILLPQVEDLCRHINLQAGC